MDDDLRQAFATLSAQISSVGDDTRATAALARETAAEMKHVAGEVKYVAVKVEQLERVVYGSKPPPAVPTMPVFKRITHNEGELAELAGQVIAASAKIDALADLNTKQDEKLHTLTEMQEKQTAMLTGITKALGHPMVRKIAWGFGVLILAWLATKGVH